MGVLLLTAGVAVALLGLLASRGLLPRNRFVGLPSAETLASETAWYAAHRSAAWWAAAGGAAMAANGANVVACAEGMLWWGCRLLDPAVVSVLAMGAFGLVLVGALRGQRLAGKLNRALEEHADVLRAAEAVENGPPDPIEIQWRPASRPPQTRAERIRAARLGWQEDSEQVHSVPFEPHPDVAKSTNGSSSHHTASHEEEQRPDVE